MIYLQGLRGPSRRHHKREVLSLLLLSCKTGQSGPPESGTQKGTNGEPQLDAARLPDEPGCPIALVRPACQPSARTFMLTDGCCLLQYSMALPYQSSKACLNMQTAIFSNE